MDVIGGKGYSGPARQPGQLGTHAGYTQPEGKVNQVPVKVPGDLIFFGAAIFDHQSGSHNECDTAEVCQPFDRIELGPGSVQRTAGEQIGSIHHNKQDTGHDKKPDEAIQSQQVGRLAILIFSTLPELAMQQDGRNDPNKRRKKSDDFDFLLGCFALQQGILMDIG